MLKKKLVKHKADQGHFFCISHVGFTIISHINLDSESFICKNVVDASSVKEQYIGKLVDLLLLPD